MKNIILALFFVYSYSLDVVWNDISYISSKHYKDALLRFKHQLINEDAYTNTTIWQNSQLITQDAYNRAKNIYFKKLYPQKYYAIYSRYVIAINNLMWQDEPYSAKGLKSIKKSIIFNKSVTFYYAFEYCKNLNLISYNDWRLPNIRELKQLYSNKELLNNNVKDYFWSSSYDPNFINNGIVYGFGDNKIKLNSKDRVAFVRCVRGID